MKPTRLALLVLTAASTLAWPARAFAEEIVLVTGTRYEASEVKLLPGAAGSEGSVQFAFTAQPGRGLVTLPFERVEARSLFGLAVARADAKDPQAQLGLARFALARGLLGEATYRFRRAADMDKALGPERDAGLALVRDAQGDRQLVDAEGDLRRGRSDLALTKAHEVELHASPGSALAARASGIAELATRVIDRDRVQRDAEVAKRAEAAVAAQDAAYLSGITRADRACVSAVKERARASDPALSHGEALKALTSAEAQLREGRRLLAVVRPVAPAHVAEIDGRDQEAFRLLVATTLDVADLYRTDRRFERARDYLRAAQILDPENARITEIRNLIEQDLHAPPVYPPPDDYWPGFEVSTYGGGYDAGSLLGTGGLCRPYGGYRSYGYGGGWRGLGGCGSGFSVRLGGGCGSWGFLGHW